MIRSYVVLILTCILLVACEKDQPVPTDPGYDYFPNQLGHYCIYDVDSTFYDDFTGDTFYFHYQVKEVIESYFTDNQGRTAMRIERYRRDYNDSISINDVPWHLSRIWSFTRTNDRAEKLEENIRYVRLAFPVKNAKYWNGNSFNNQGEWNYKYILSDVPYSLNNMIFDSTLAVQQIRRINEIEHREYVELYAKHVGLIEKRVIDVKDNEVNLSIPLLDRIESGVIYSIRLIEYRR